MFTGIDILVLLVAMLFIFYLAGPEKSDSEFKLEFDPAMIILVLVLIAIVVAAV